jgi:hypothetical protein
VPTTHTNDGQLSLPGLNLPEASNARQARAVKSFDRGTNVICHRCLSIVRELHHTGRSVYYCNGCHELIIIAARHRLNRGGLTQRDWRRLSAGPSSPEGIGRN